MSEKQMYVIDENNYLFKNKIKKTKKRLPEESVRQWTLFELMSTYGYLITDITIEEKTRDHGGTYFADIVVRKENEKFAVIECKRHKRNNRETALKQAKSYADDLGAKYAVYTDGNEWLVEKKSGETWFPVLHLPKVSNFSYDSTLSGVVTFLHHLAPLLYWLYQPIPENHAER